MLNEKFPKIAHFSCKMADFPSTDFKIIHQSESQIEENLIYMGNDFTTGAVPGWENLVKQINWWVLHCTKTDAKRNETGTSIFLAIVT